MGKYRHCIEYTKTIAHRNGKRTVVLRCSRYAPGPSKQEQLSAEQIEKIVLEHGEPEPSSERVAELCLYKDEFIKLFGKPRVVWRKFRRVGKEVDIRRAKDIETGKPVLCIAVGTEEAIR